MVATQSRRYTTKSYYLKHDVGELLIIGNCTWFSRRYYRHWAAMAWI